MKQVCAGLVVILFAVPALAQIESGDFRVSAGLAGFSYTSLDAEGVDIEMNDFGLTPGGSARFGYAIDERIECGLDLSAEYEKVDIEGSDADAWLWGIGPYIGANFAINEAKTLLLGPSLRLGYTRLNSDVVDLDLFQVVIGGELKTFVAKDASIDLGLFLAYSTGSADFDGGNFDLDGFSVGPQVRISIWP
jgi:hypothetical protein